LAIARPKNHQPEAGLIPLRSFQITRTATDGAFMKIRIWIGNDCFVVVRSQTPPEPCALPRL